jgi:UDP-N-acetylglucosamine 3-dehydrogenase
MVRVGLAGLGFMGGTHAQCHAALPNSKLVAVADPEADRRQRFADTYGARPFASIDEMLASVELDMVDICMPTYLHREAVEKVAAAGKHVLCEKPMALTLEDCDAMIAATREAKVKFMVAQVLRFWPEYVVMKEILDSGRLGRIKWVSATRMSSPPTWSWEEWLFDPVKSGGAVLDLHIHDLDMINWLIGKPRKVMAAGVKTRRGGLDNVFTMTMGHKDDVVAFAEGSLDMAGGFPFTMGLKVACEGGDLELNTRLTPSLLLAPASGGVEYPAVPEVRVETAAAAGSAGNISALGGYFVEVKYFVDCIDQRKKPDRVTPKEAKLAVAMCLAALKSAETKRAVAVRSR